MRIIYFWDKPSERLFMLFAYSKREVEDLTQSQLKVLARLIEEEFK